MSIFGTYTSLGFDGGDLSGPTAGPTGPTGAKAGIAEGLNNFLFRIGNNIDKTNREYTDQLVGGSEEESSRILGTEYINVKDQLPSWIQSRNDSSDALLVKIFQKYYDWLYSPNGSQYILDDRFQYVNDARLSPDETIRYLLSTYLPNATELSDIIIEGVAGAPGVGSPFVSDNSIRNFLSGVRDTFYQKKGTPQSIAYFFNTLLSATSTQITQNIDDPLTYDLHVTFPVATIESYYSDYYREFIHPVGMGVNITQEMTSFNPSVAFLGGGESGGFSGDIPQFTAWEELTYGDGAYDGTGTGEEISIIGNYFPYALGDTNDIAASAGCCGSTAHGGISGGATGNTANMLTFAFPDWSTAVSISGSSFGLINIYDFGFLSAASGSTSPNDGRVTNYSCPAGGYS
jgi:hypothetical protein|tara:strand:+ start:9877 stop:11085 length:1209 start_codon:yes stop_codon:yes gene_type:complete